MIHDKFTCSRCILTIKDSPSIVFNSKGICNYCLYYDSLIKSLGSESERKQWIDTKIIEIKKYGQKKKYDCILGISGGIDSTYLSYWAKQNNLRPLVVHFDNGWNSELAAENIKNICEKLDFNLHTYVINWDEFKALQVAYLKAGVVDIEAITDHAIMATIFRYATKYKIKYILSGFNYATEAIMPKEWIFDKTDSRNIFHIFSSYENLLKLKSYPHLSFFKKLYNHWVHKIESVQVLNYINYNKFVAKELIIKELAWRDYGGKHHESIFTKFYQNYILPEKYKIDKRKAHLSSLINSGQITKEIAQKIITEPLFESENQKLLLKTYVLKKLELSELEFDKILHNTIRNHNDFKTEKKMWEFYFLIIKIFKFWKA